LHGIVCCDTLVFCDKWWKIEKQRNVRSKDKHKIKIKMYRLWI
jgi:hypothetical protein